MKFLVAIAVFFGGLLLGASFIGAVMMAVAAWVVLLFFTSAPAEQPRSGARQSSAPRPELDDFASLRAYVQQLALRVEALERQLAPKVEMPAPKVETPPPPAPKVEMPLPPPVELPKIELPKVELPKVQPSKAPPPVVPPVIVRPPVVADEPSFLSRLLAGNIVAKVGAIVLFFGVGFLLKFAYDRGMMPPELRLLGVALAAAVAFGIGWTLREKRRLYGLILQGVASGLLYLDVYFALKTFGFIGATAGFALFALLGVFTVLFAVRQDARPMALLGLTGAFLAPILAATGSGNHVTLFSYYLLLNLFILAVSWFKAWRSLNLTGWFFSLAVGMFWGSRSYRPDLFWSVEPFLLAFFAIYLVIPVLFATRQPPSLKGLVDGTLVFGTPATVAALQARLVSDMPYGLAWSAAIGAALYAVMAATAWRQRNMRLLAETYTALAVGLGTLAIFFAFGAYTTFALWSIEGAALLWVGLRQKHLLARISGVLVQAAGAGYFFLDYPGYSRLNPYFNDAVLGCLIIVVAALLSAGLLRRHRDAIGTGERDLGGFILAWAALWWSLGGVDVIQHGVEHPFKPAAAIVFFSLTGVLAEVAGSRLTWPGLRALTVVQSVALLVVALLQPSVGHPLSHLGWLAWPLGLGSLFWILHRQRRDAFGAAFLARYVLAWVVLAGVATIEAAWRLGQQDYLACLGLALVAYVAGALRYRLREHRTDAPPLSALPLMWAMLFWFGAAFAWIHDALPDSLEVRAGLLVVAGSALAFEAAHTMLGWPAMRWAARLPWLAIPLALFADLGIGVDHPFSGWLGIAWPAVWLLAVYGLWRDETRDENAFSGLQHPIAFYVPIVLTTWELLWWLEGWGAQWRLAAFALPSAVAVVMVAASSGSERWPLREHWPLYRDVLLPLPIVCLAAWFLVANFQAPGDLRPLTAYVPLFSPLDVTIAVAALGIGIWASQLESSEARGAVTKAITGFAFIWLNAMVLRTVHYWADVPYRLDALASSVVVQTSLSILWTGTALALMALARSKMERGPWLAGAALLAVVVGKLFLVDLSGTGTVARIVSFLGVGVLLLVIGYVAPVPPGETEAEERS